MPDRWREEGCWRLVLSPVQESPPAVSSRYPSEQYEFVHVAAAMIRVTLYPEVPGILRSGTSAHQYFCRYLLGELEAAMSHEQQR